MKKAVAVLAYDRFDYASLVLPSLFAQEINGQPLQDVYDIWLFQDGLCVEDSRSDADGHARIGKLFTATGNTGRVRLQPANLGVAGHFDFVEKTLFREQGYDYVVFCEDDLVLAPGYLETMDRLAERFHGDPRVGMVSAHPAHVSASLEEQWANVGSLRAMDHNWGFGLFREFWERRQPFVEHYLEILGTTPYRQRPHQVVFDWLEACGFEPAASSQDYVKQCATMALGAVRVATAYNLGLPIGRSGLHCSPEMFRKMGFDKTVVFRGSPGGVGALGQEQYTRLLASQASKMKAPPRAPEQGIDEVAVAAWTHKVALGETRVANLLGSDWLERHHARLAAAQSPPPTPVREWNVADIPATPEMAPESLGMFRDRLGACSVFLEYGAGSTTLLAASQGVGTIVSVTSDRGLLDAIGNALDPDGSMTFHAEAIDVGPTDDWGNPTAPAAAPRWPNYSASVWTGIADGTFPQPDLVLVKGRFRVACCLATLLQARPGTVILFDDYGERSHYHVVETFLQPAERAGSMACFVVPEAPPPGVLPALLAYSTDFR